MRQLKLIILAAALLDMLTGYGGFIPLPEVMAAAQATPANPISSQQITFPVFTLIPQPATGATLQLVGNPGPKAIFYWVVSKYAVGNANLAGPFVITNAPNTLSAANAVRVLPILGSGATNYDLLKTASTIPPGGACACAVATNVAAGTFTNDQANGTGAYTVNTFDINTLNMTVQNEVQSAGVSHWILRQNGVLVQDLSSPSVSFPLNVLNGSAAAPSYSFGLTAGMFFSTGVNGGVSFSNSGTEFFRILTVSGLRGIQVPDDSGAVCIGATFPADTCFWRLGSSQVGFGTGTAGDFSGNFRSGALSGGNTGDIGGYNQIFATTLVNSPTYQTTTNCSSAASPAVCASAAAGRVVIAAAATTVQVNTTKVTANSEIKVQFDESLTGLGTCQAGTSEGATYFVSARSAGTSFTIKTNVAVVANVACLSYTIVN